MSHSEKSYIPHPPKSIGLSRRLLIAVVTVILCVMLLFLLFLKRYSPKATTHIDSLSMVGVAVNQDDSSAQIAKIASEAHLPMLVALKKETEVTSIAKVTNITPETKLNVANSHEFREGSNPRISVYHHMDSNIAASQPAVSYSPNTAIGTSNPFFGIQPPTINAYQTQNSQSKKIAFLKQSHQKTKTLIESTLQKPLSPYEINAGTIIPATLMTGIHSSLPGALIAKVRRDIFDSVSGNYLLIPQGTTLIGQYDSQVSYGQSRVLIVWSRLIFPNGSSFDLQGMPGADLTGMAGLHDKVDHHYARLFGSALLFSLFGASGQLSQPKNNSSQPSTQQILYAAIGQQLSQTAMQLMEKNMNIQPTLKIRPGMRFNVLLTRDMVLPQPYSFLS